MKNFKRTLLALLVIVLSLTAITACSDNDAPEGMQLCMGSDELGFYFYVPKEWQLANQGDYAAAYPSALNSTSVSFVRAEMPECSIAEYFAAERVKFPFDITVTADLTACNFGNADNAYSCVYNYTYKEAKFCAMQIFAIKGESFYIFTYNSSAEMRDDEKTHYSFFLEKAESCMKNVKFVDKKESAPTQTEYERDGDGHILVSDKKLSGFKLFVPDAYRVDYSSAIVNVTRADGASINVSEPTFTNVTRDQYWQTRVENLTLIADKNSVSIIKEHEKVEGLDCDWAYAYEYTFSFGTRQYHIYQVLIVDGYDGYVFTYCAPEGVFASHLEEAKTALSKLKF